MSRGRVGRGGGGGGGGGGGMYICECMCLYATSIVHVKTSVILKLALLYFFPLLLFTEGRNVLQEVPEFWPDMGQTVEVDAGNFKLSMREDPEAAPDYTTREFILESIQVINCCSLSSSSSYVSHCHQHHCHLFLSLH